MMRLSQPGVELKIPGTSLNIPSLLLTGDETVHFPNKTNFNVLWAIKEPPGKSPIPQ